VALVKTSAEDWGELACIGEHAVLAGSRVVSSSGARSCVLFFLGGCDGITASFRRCPRHRIRRRRYLLRLLRLFRLFVSTYLTFSHDTSPLSPGVRNATATLRSVDALERIVAVYFYW
jgi:hypothetical protein